MPVEFHGIVIGPQAATEDNVTDEALRCHIAEVGSRYVDFYFGQLDCHRVVCSNSVKTLPQLLAWRDTAYRTAILRAGWLKIRVPAHL